MSSSSPLASSIAPSSPIFNLGVALSQLSINTFPSPQSLTRILHDESGVELVQQIFGLAKACQLTPCHAAAGLAEPAVVLDSIAKSSPKDLNAPDFRGWRPIHHAALQGNEVMLKILKTAGANPTLKTDANATYLDIQRLINPPKKSSQALTGLLFESEIGEIPLSCAAFEELTGAKYIEENVASKEYLHHEWRHPTKEHDDFKEHWPVSTEHLQQAYMKHREESVTFPQFVLRRIRTEASTQSSSKGIGLGVYAKSAIPQGGLLKEYVGVKMIGESYGEYSAGTDIDAKKFRNEMAMINDGFPNARFYKLANAAGLKERIVVVATDDIPPNDKEQICLNYGATHSIKFKFPYIELRPQALRTFVKEELLELTPCIDWEKIIRFYCTKDDNASSPLADELKRFAFNDKMRYLLNTPAALFALILEGTLTSEQGQKLLNIAYSIGIDNGGLSFDDVPVVCGYSYTIVRELCLIAQRACIVRKYIERCSPELTKDYYDYITALTAHFGTVPGLHFAKEATNFFHHWAKEAKPQDLKTAAEKEQAAQLITPMWHAMKQQLDAKGDTYLRQLAAAS